MHWELLSERRTPDGAFDVGRCLPDAIGVQNPTSYNIKNSPIPCSYLHVICENLYLFQTDLFVYLRVFFIVIKFYD